HAHLVRRARIAVGRVDRALVVTDEHVLDPRLLEKLVVDVENRPAGAAEDVVDAFFLKTADQDFRARQFHESMPRKSVAPSRRTVVVQLVALDGSARPPRLGVESREWAIGPSPGRLVGARGAAEGGFVGPCCNTASEPFDPEGPTLPAMPKAVKGICYGATSRPTAGGRMSVRL